MSKLTRGAAVGVVGAAVRERAKERQAMQAQQQQASQQQALRAEQRAVKLGSAQSDHVIVCGWA